MRVFLFQLLKARRGTQQTRGFCLSAAALSLINNTQEEKQQHGEEEEEGLRHRNAPACPIVADTHKIKEVNLLGVLAFIYKVQ